MKQLYRQILLLPFLAYNLSAHVIPYYSPRSQSENLAREIVLWQSQINAPCQEDNYGVFSIIPEYTRSYQPPTLMGPLFCDALDTATCCDNRCSIFRVQGSRVASRTPRSLLAEYFGLPTDYDSIIALEPRIQNFIVDFAVYVGLDRWCPGLYVYAHAPFVNTQWDLGFCETINASGSAPHPLGYFNGAFNGSAPNYYSVARENLVNTFEGFIARKEIPFIDGVSFQPLDNARIAKCGRQLSKLSDIQFMVGWNPLSCDNYHVGINLRVVAPTGSRPEGCWLFEPVVGNGKHWEAGAGISTHWIPWRKGNTDNFGFYLDAHITHLFKTHQCRTFDLCGKPLSRYMLAAKMSQPALNISDANGDIPAYQFANEFSSVANLSTINVDVSAAIQGDLVFKFVYSHQNFQCDLGYEFWGRSCEKVRPRCRNTQPEIWALKGDAFVYGFTALSSSSAIPLSATESEATIFCGTNNAQRSVQNNLYWTRNPGIDNPQLAVNGSSVPIMNNQDFGSGNFFQMYSSFDPIIFSTGDTSQWNFKAQSRGLSHKVFSNFGYVWRSRDCWQPFIGIGVEVEMGQTCKLCCSAKAPHCITNSPTPALTEPTESSIQSCCPVEGEKTCIDAAISQWGLWIKGGASYN